MANHSSDFTAELNEKDSNMQNIKEKVIVIAGASSGLGEATARLLAAEGEALWWVRDGRWIGYGLGHSNEFVEAGAVVAFADVPGGKNMRNMTTRRKPAVGSLRAVRVLTTLLSIACSVLWAAAASAADATEQAVLAAHEKRRDATLAGDAAAVGSMMTDDLTFTHANAVVETKAEFLDALKTGRYQYKSITDEERGVRVHGDAGIVSGTCRIVVTASGKDIDIRVRFTELWVKEGGAWRMLLWHATNVP